jgi:hypothetical protein
MGTRTSRRGRGQGEIDIRGQAYTLGASLLQVRTRFRDTRTSLSELDFEIIDLIL